MILLVTCTRAILAVEPASGRAWVIDDANGVYYGIALLGDRIYVGARRSPYGVDRDGRAAQRGVLLEFDARLRLLGPVEAPFPLRDIHQLHACDGRVLVACTHDDLVAEFDPVRRVWDRWFPLGAHDEPDRFHLNSLCHDGDELFIAGNKRGSGTLYRFGRGDRSLLGRVELGKGAHNVWREDGELFTCGSAEGMVRSTGGLAFEVSAYVRGAASLPDRRFLGLSSNLEDRHRRPHSYAEVMELGVDWSVTQRLLIPGLGMIHDLRVPGAADRCHPDEPGPAIEVSGLGRFPRLDLVRDATHEFSRIRG